MSISRAARSYRPERGPAAPWLYAVARTPNPDRSPVQNGAPGRYAVARNAIIDRSRVHNEPPADPPDEASPEAGPPERVEAGWTAWRVHRALEELSQNERAVIELAYWSGLSQSEVADYLGIPLGTVKTRTRAALARLA